jgi:hypothetical protein
MKEGDDGKEERKQNETKQNLSDAGGLGKVRLGKANGERGGG